MSGERKRSPPPACPKAILALKRKTPGPGAEPQNLRISSPHAYSPQARPACAG
jgi:hypothetical protein